MKNKILTPLLFGKIWVAILLIDSLNVAVIPSSFCQYLTVALLNKNKSVKLQDEIHVLENSSFSKKSWLLANKIHRSDDGVRNLNLLEEKLIFKFAFQIIEIAHIFIDKMQSVSQ